MGTKEKILLVLLIVMTIISISFFTKMLDVEKGWRETIITTGKVHELGSIDEVLFVKFYCPFVSFSFVFWFVFFLNPTTKTQEKRDLEDEVKKIYLDSDQD